MRIYGIDASLRSTGVCVVDVKFEQRYATDLMEILLGVNEGHCSHEQAESFNNSVKVVLKDQIPQPKPIKKKLAKIRKKIRDDIDDKGESYQEDILENMNLEVEAMLYQNEQIMHYHNQLRPSISVMEDYSFQSNGSLVQLAEMKGAFRCMRSFEVFIAPITSVKKIGSTNGRATKSQMFENIQRYPFYDIIYDEKRDDEIDALAICLSTFYSIYDRIIGLPFPKPQNSKDRTKIKSWKNCLESFANHIGTKDDMMEMLDDERI